MSPIQRTILFPSHIESSAQMVSFGGWEMPLNYPAGILQEHLVTRRAAGLFDISHMGRFVVGGDRALPFLQHVLTNNAAALQVGQSQYTILADIQGGAVDDAYLFRFFDDRYLLVVNAANRQKDWDHLNAARRQFNDVTLEDQTLGMAMLSLQGPQSTAMLAALIDKGALPEPRRNALSFADCGTAALWISRTGYTGEPVCYEICMPAETAPFIWKRLKDLGAQPAGLGARDSLRLEAGLPLYGHELGTDPEGRFIPIFALSLARFAVSFSPLKGDFIGRNALLRQFQAAKASPSHHPLQAVELPRRIRTVEIVGKGIARAGDEVLFQNRPAGFITSGTMVPYWEFEGEGTTARMTSTSHRRAIALALIDIEIQNGAEIVAVVRGKEVRAAVMPYLLRSETPSHARPITWPLYQQRLAAKAAG